jgi:hypothetical protein
MEKIEFVDEVPLAPGHSTEYQEAEGAMLKLLSAHLGATLEAFAMLLPNGARMEIDGADEDHTIFVEAFAPQGRAKPGQRRKLALDMLKLAYLARLRPDARKILLLSDEQLAVPLRSSRSWLAQAIDEFGIEVMVVSLPADIREGLMTAQVRQFR